MMKIGGLIGKLFGFKHNEPKKMAYNDDFALMSENGEHRLEHFTGHVSFDERTECDVEDADITFIVGNAGYIDGSERYWAPWSRGVNAIEFRGGVVKSGNLKCRVFENGEFNGDTLVVVKNRMNGKFNGRNLHENVKY